MFDEKHIRKVVESHTFEHKGKRYRVALERLLLDPRLRAPEVEPIAVDLHFVAPPEAGGTDIRLHLHVGPQTVAADAYLRDVIDHSFRDIIEGKLPPGARELL